MLEELLRLRRDTRHFTSEEVPEEVLQKAIHAGHMAPSVGLTDATRYYVVRSVKIKEAIKALFDEYNLKASAQINLVEKKEKYDSLKLEAIIDAPIGLVVCYDRSVLNDFTIGTIASNETLKFSAVCAIQNIWLSLTEHGYSMGWVSILNYYRFKKILNLPDEIEPLGYFCVGKAATDYGKQPMLQQVAWKNKEPKPSITEIDHLQDERFDLPKPQNKIGKDITLLSKLKAVIDNKTKPLGALGTLEQLALQIGTIFGTVTPKLTKPHIVVFAADHGIAQHGVSAYPQDVTRQMVNNFLEGGAAINVFCRQNNLQLLVVDAGVNYDFAPNENLINFKIGKGTQSFLNAAAMSASEMELCITKGELVIRKLFSEGCNTVGFGEMGIGNTSSAAILMNLLTGIPLDQCVGRGTGLNDEQLRKKQFTLGEAVNNYKGDGSDKSYMGWFGGFEILQIAGAMLEAQRLNMLILVDGFISTVAFLCAYKIDENVKNNTIFCHQSDESGHLLLLNFLKVKPLINLKMRLGEGSGCAVAFPLIKSAIAFLNEMASFENADVDNKSI